MKCIKLTYRSPVFGSVQCEELPNEDARCIDFSPETALRLYEKNPEVLLNLVDFCEDLAWAVPEELKGLVVRAVFGDLDEYYSQLNFVTHIYVRQDITDEQDDQIIDWITGQMSDGWGEGVEQRAVYKEDVCYDIVDFDEDNCEFETIMRRDEALYYLHPWANDISWRVELVGRETAEIDVEEPDANEELRQSVLRIKELIDEVVDELKKIT